ncbi:MAG: dehypoxanthine futalosine cyclase [Candidatus Sumerlaeota bacterium]|nr:dehypoxanthine futalosine cyclase [Candidatus Sumerlaeota bacterium]
MKRDSRETPFLSADPAPILERAAGGGRISEEECLALFRCRDLLAIGRAAHQARLSRTDPGAVTYTCDRNTNYTNACITGCAFCAFSRKPGDPDAYVLGESEFRAKIRELYERGGSQLLLQGGLHPGLPLEWHEGLLRWLRAEWPHLHLHCYSPPEIAYMAREARIPVFETIRRLREAGLQSIPGGGAEILSDRVRRKVSPRKISADEWIDVMRQASRAGLRASATMMFGHVETLEERVEHLRRVRDLQDETGVFTAFIAWTFQPKNAAVKEEFCGAYEYLRAAAIARLYLDNIPNHQASWVTQGPKIGQMSLFFGLNDLGSTMIEENVVREAGTAYRMDADELEAMAREAGFRPVKRNYYYEPYDHPADAPEGRRQRKILFPAY